MKLMMTEMAENAKQTSKIQYNNKLECNQPDILYEYLQIFLNINLLDFVNF